MRGVEAKRGVLYSGSDPLSVILAARYTYDDKLIRVLTLELPQLRQHMKAVYSPIGPEIEKDQLAPQILQLQRASTGMNPIQIVWKLRSTHGRCEWKFTSHLEWFECE